MNLKGQHLLFYMIYITVLFSACLYRVYLKKVNQLWHAIVC